MVFGNLFGSKGNSIKEIRVSESSIMNGMLEIECDGTTYHCDQSVSDNSRFTLAFADGSGGLNNSVEKGRIFLLENKKLLFTEEITRPNAGSVTNKGICAIVDWVDWDSQGGRLCVYNSEGELLFEKNNFESNIEFCALTKNYVAGGVLNPDCKTYIYNYRTGEKVLEHENIDGNKFDAEFVERGNELFLDLYSRQENSPSYRINMNGEKLDM